MEGTAESIRPEMVYIRNTKREKADDEMCQLPQSPFRCMSGIYSPVGRARLSAATRSMVDQGACLNPAILPERFMPQMVKMVPTPFCI
jgi:hypothetical protein